jgi:hypothetical protein
MDSAVDRFARTLLVVWQIVALSGCVYEWNGDQPPFPLTGNPPAASSFTRLNQVVAGRFSLMSGPDGASWAAFCEFWKMGSGNAARNCGKMRLVRLGLPGDAPAEEAITADSFAIHGQELFEMRDDMTSKMRTVTMHRPGGSDDVPFPFPSGKATLYVNDAGAADVFVYWLEDPSTTSVGVYRRDKQFQLNVPLPAGVDPTKLPPSQFDFLLSADGDHLVVRTGDGTMTSYSTTSDATVALGTRPSDWFIDDARQAVLTFGDDGIRSVPLDGSAERVLSPANIDVSTLSLVDDTLYYGDAGGLWQVLLDGSAPARLAQPGGVRLWAATPQLTYSKDPRSKYAGGAGDGWVGDWRFMERGRFPRWSSDGARIHFLEHAATVGTYGDLTSVSVPGGAPRLLAVNTHEYDELPDHRILAVENAVYAGEWNRLVIIDEDANTKHWVVPSAVDFLLVNNGTELVADVVSGASGYDIVRLPAP